MPPTLPSDIMSLLAGRSLRLAVTISLVCREWREIPWRLEHRQWADDLSRLFERETCLLKDLVIPLRLPLRVLRSVAHKRKGRWGGGHYKIYERDVVIETFVRHGGLEGVEKRRERYSSLHCSRVRGASVV